MAFAALNHRSDGFTVIAGYAFVVRIVRNGSVDAFKNSGWKDRLNAADIRKFWEVRGLAFPSPSDWAAQNDLLTPETLSARMSDLERKLKDS